MRKLIDSDSEELKSILEALLREDVDVTVREVARRHSCLKNASAFTRSSARMELISGAQQRQRDARSVRGSTSAQHQSLAEKLREANERNAVLEEQLRALIASHAACVRAVMLHGGTAALERFWTQYKAVADTVRELGAMPTGARVVPLNPPKPRKDRPS